MRHLINAIPTTTNLGALQLIDNAIKEHGPIIITTFDNDGVIQSLIGMDDDGYTFRNNKPVSTIADNSHDELIQYTKASLGY